jgi:hypothetical protein
MMTQLTPQRNRATTTVSMIVTTGLLGTRPALQTLALKHRCAVVVDTALSHHTVHAREDVTVLHQLDRQRALHAPSARAGSTELTTAVDFTGTRTHHLRTSPAHRGSQLQK